MSAADCSDPPVAYTVRPRRVRCSTKNATATTTSAMSTPGVVTTSLTFGPSTTFMFVASERSGDSSSRRSGTVLRMDARPRPRNIIASVAMNGCTSKNWISTPETTPEAVPMRIISTITTHGSQPALARITPATLLTATIAPTDRSMPPVRITNVRPTASTMTCALLMRRFDSVAACRMRPYAISP